MLGLPCITLRDVTEWVETVEGGNVLAGSDEQKILSALMAPIPVKPQRDL